MLYKATLVCEGGAMMGVFSAGVLDYLLEKEIYFDRAIGVSIGAGVMVCYASRQKGRAIECMAVRDKSIAYVGFRSLLKNRKFFNYDLCYEGFGDLYIPFDYDAFAVSETKCEAVVADLRTGKPAYLPCVAKYHQAMDAARASGTLPVISPAFAVNGIECYDGGVVDPIPLERAKSYGNKKIVVVMTKVPGYRKKPDGDWENDLFDRYYDAYPLFREAMRNRAAVYNKKADELDKLDKEGKIFVFRPPEPPCSRIESDYDDLRAGYDLGRKIAAERFDELIEYLNE